MLFFSDIEYQLGSCRIFLQQSKVSSVHPTRSLNFQIDSCNYMEKWIKTVWRHAKIKLNYIKMWRKTCNNHLQHVFLWVDPCLFNLVCLTEVNSKFMLEKTAIFIFHFILFFQIALINNDQPNVLFFPKHSRYVRVNFARVKGSTTKYYVLLLSLLLCSMLSLTELRFWYLWFLLWEQTSTRCRRSHSNILSWVLNKIVPFLLF